MKIFTKLHFFLLLSLLPGTWTHGHGQVNAMFPESDAVWTYELELFFVGGSMIIYEQFFLNGDTTLGGVDYVQLWSNGNPSQPIDTSSSTYHGALRVDSLGRVFYRGAGSTAGSSTCLGFSSGNQINPEVMLYDWTRVVGDTNLYIVGSDTVRSVVTGIDTVMVAGVPRRRFELFEGFGGGGDGPRYEIEGIGSEEHFFWPWCNLFESENTLICFKDSTINYSAAGYSCAGILAVEEGLEKEVEVKVSPHPVVGSSRLSLESGLLGAFDLEIFDLRGQIAMARTLEAGQSISVGRETLLSGMYFYQVSQHGNVLQTGKLLVQ